MKGGMKLVRIVSILVLTIFLANCNSNVCASTFEQAMELFKKGRYGDAHDKLVLLLNRNIGDKPEILYYIARCKISLLKRKTFYYRVEAFGRADGLIGKFTVKDRYMIKKSILIGDINEILDILEKIVKKYPDSSFAPLALFTAGNLCYKQETEDKLDFGERLDKKYYKLKVTEFLNPQTGNWEKTIGFGYVTPEKEMFMKDIIKEVYKDNLKKARHYYLRLIREYPGSIYEDSAILTLANIVKIQGKVPIAK